MDVNYYEVLECDKNTSDVDIKKQYRKLAMKWHPDKNASSPEASVRFQEIGEAYDVLSDPQRRAVYDKYGVEGLVSGAEDADFKGGYEYKQNAQELFENFFGSANPFAAFGFADSQPFAAKLSKPGPKKLPAVENALPCTLSELFNGCVKKFSVTRMRKNESGEYVSATKVLVMHIKPGWKKGTRITFPLEGDEEPGAIAADIVFVIAEKEDGCGYTREGDNLVYTYKISLADALSDCCLQVPTLDNRVLSIACPEVVSPYSEKLVRGEGMSLPTKTGAETVQRGDLLIRFRVLFPAYLNGTKKLKMRELLANEQLQA